VKKIKAKTADGSLNGITLISIIMIVLKRYKMLIKDLVLGL
jgi:hypothetical protein